MASDSVSLLTALTQNRELPQSRYCLVRSHELQFSADMPARITATASSDVAAVVCRGIPWVSEECSRRWLGERLLYFPDGIPDSRRISLISSRLRQRLDQELWWFDLLRTVMLQCDPKTEMIMTAANTTASAAALRAARLFARPVIHFSLPDDTHESCSSLVEWLQMCQQQISPAESFAGIPDFCRVFVSPELPEKQNSMNLRQPADSPGRKTPLGDRVLVAASSRIYALAMRPKGIVSQILGYQLMDTELRTRPLMLACDAKGELPPAADDLPAGWVAWLLQPFADESSNAEDAAVSLPCSASAQQSDFTAKPGLGSERSASDPIGEPEHWLLHWTRAKAGPWPGETQDDFLDAMILQTESADHSALATLLRIISNGRLAASADGIRGGHAVVSFTAVSLSEFRERRVFRKHRHRFDFEPWGIGICRSALLHLGARPVVYEQPKNWLTLNPEDRPFFQKATTDGATNNCAEQEWRVIGDVDLSQLPSDAVCVFVDNAETAALVARHTAWRVIVTPGLPRS